MDTRSRSWDCKTRAMDPTAAEGMAMWVLEALRMEGEGAGVDSGSWTIGTMRRRTLDSNA